MPVPRPSESAEAARAAALQAEFNEKKWVWIPDDKEGYLGGWVINEHGDMGEVVMAAGGEARKIPLYALSKMNPPKFDRVDDIADLTFLNEASVVHNLRLRYGSGAIYTYSGLFLVAINPYTNLPLYSDAIVQQYRGKRRDDNPPHIFAIAERAWANMGEERENQSILITGESGAGKTENTKKVIQYLAAIAVDMHYTPSPTHSRSPSVVSGSPSFPIIPSTGLPRNTSFKNRVAISGGSSKLGLLERQILQANPILEAFGNAQTQRNNNSSRFGKFIRISFAPDGSIAGANIDWYLLEKSRVVVRSEVERSFHVFYQLLEGEGTLKATLLLEGAVADYEYLNTSRASIDGVDDREEWRLLKNALDVVGFAPSEQLDLFRVVAAVLHIGNIEITADRSDQAQIKTPAQAEKACHLLGISVQEFTKAVLRPRVLAGREWVTQARTKQQALDELSSLCKTLYEKSFGALVDRINRALERPSSSKSTFIGVLDIAGFEIFETNAFEQLTINYTNEKLQQFFNHHMFVLEQEEYQRENIEWDFVNFGLDLQPTIDLIESGGTVIGILSCLDEECIMPKATDLTFTNKLHALWTGDVPDTETPHPGRAKYSRARFDQGEGFIVQHYAGKVEYRTDGWLEKNKDPLNDNLTRVLAGSAERYVAGLFAEYADTVALSSGTVGKKRVLKKGAFRTVGQRHKEQLASLMAQLHATQPHFVRCIVPNQNKRPGRVDTPLVLDQLRCNGVLEGIRIARLGYPNRLPFVEFRQRYEVLTPGIIPKGYMDGRKACLRMVDALELDKVLFKIGTSKIFFKAGVLAELEERRDGLLYDVFSRLQAVARMWTARRQMKKILNRAVAIRTIQRNARTYGQLREWPWWQLYTKVRPMLAATRNDDELRKKNAELELIRERAERDQREREALEALKMRLEQGKQKVEEELEAERNLAIDKDALLERSKRREGELEDDVQALQADIDILDSQLDRALKAQKATEEKYEALTEAFDQAARHLVRLEKEEEAWISREAALSDELKGREGEIEVLSSAKEEYQKSSEELQRLVTQREEDITRVKERMDGALADMESKLHAETTARDLGLSKLEGLEKEARQAKEQLAELARTATDYSNMLQKREADIARLSNELSTSHRERDLSKKQSAELQGQLETFTTELNAQRSDRDRDAQSRAKLQVEIDELRALMDAKTSEDSKRAEVERSKEQELSGLRQQASRLQEQLAEARRLSVEEQSKLKVELENLQAEHVALQRSHDDLLQKGNTLEAQHKDVSVSLIAAEKARRAAESELQSIRTRQIDVDGQLAEVVKTKEGLERQLVAAQAKHQDFEDAVLQIEREKASWVRQMDSLRKQLEAESARRAQLDQANSNHHAEIVKYKDRTAKLELDLNKSLNDLHARDWEVSQLRSKQDKTIVEHVHVLEEAKKVTDRQLAEAQLELQSQTAYIRSLEKTKSRLSGEAEDLARDAERERAELRAKEKAARAQEERATRALLEVEKERKAREAAEGHARRLQSELNNSQNQLADASQQVDVIQRSKTHLETELATLAAETDSHNALPKLRRQYETRITQLESQVEMAEFARTTAERIKQRIGQQHAEIRRLIAASGPKDDVFRSQLLKELQLVDDDLEREMSARSAAPRPTTEVRTYGNITPSKRASADVNGMLRMRKDSQPESPRTPDRQVSALQQQVQVLELRMMASDRVRQHLEASLREITAEFETNDGSKQSLQAHRARLAREKARLAELLEEEAEARRTAEAAQMDGVKAMWSKFQSTISHERESYAKLEDSRKALLAQQRATLTELEDHRRQVLELSQSKKQLQVENADLKDRLEVELLAKNEEIGTKRQLQLQLQELEVAGATSSTIRAELQEAVETYKSKAESYLGRLEAAEIAKVKSARSEAFARRSLADAEKTHAEALGELKAAERRIQAAEQQIRDLEGKLEDENREIGDMELFKRRLTEEMEDERDQYQKDLAERDFTIDQTRKKYQAELAQLSEELQFQRDSMSRLREENRTMRTERDDLQLRFDDEVYNGGAWKKEKERLETKIGDLTAAYEASNNANSEQQSQIVSLLSQVRELRAVLDEAEADRSALQKARRQLEGRLNDIAQHHVETSKMSSDRAFQAMHLEKQELRSALEEQEDRVNMANERLKKAESFANDSQIELNKIRAENSELDKLNANLEKQVKDLNVRIVDLETKSYASSPRPVRESRRLESRIEELTSKLTQESKEKSETLRMSRTADKSVRDTKFQLMESDRQRARLEDEVTAYEKKVGDLRQSIDALQTSESGLQLAKRRAEREAADYKARSLGLERELERLRGRLERPSAVISPASSPRKYES
ncbi:nonmuscle myosin heavy chain b [Gautieria morchelliformis]|nr:nonmuscle myosin heavy chain b [Gautieria morchelliformis]